MWRKTSILVAFVWEEYEIWIIMEFAKYPWPSIKEWSLSTSGSKCYYCVALQWGWKICIAAGLHEFFFFFFKFLNWSFVHVRNKYHNWHDWFPHKIKNSKKFKNLENNQPLVSKFQEFNQFFLFLVFFNLVTTLEIKLCPWIEISNSASTEGLGSWKLSARNHDLN